ncbi:hypothetical protein FNV43_RR18361 [Rhamnella rubrinervis]|uniref:Uncharacterized protein n=1 Tax=Rhamnella rubrinervis TaxID=2594499 RepID=A0A8K0GWD8_9ROSA|nr:hypothetical protein FNV43_RR18361 [Rhamnella rubrinervis]
MKEIMNPSKLPLIDITPTKNICPDQDDESVIIDIPEELEPDLNRTCWIHRVPTNLRQVNEAAYTPQLVSIGPFHHGKPKFKSMDKQKDKYQRQFWKRSFCKHVDEKEVITFMKKGDRIGRILGCYAGTFEHNKDDVDYWADVILKDACFIFELLLRYYESPINVERKIKETNDYILRTPLLKKLVTMDLMLLENQLPFFVFTELFDFILEAQPGDTHLQNTIPHYLSKRQEVCERPFSLIKVVIEFFGDYYLMGKPVDEQSSSQSQQIHHNPDLERSTPPPAGMTSLDAAPIPPTDDSISDLRAPLITTEKQHQVADHGSHNVRRPEEFDPESRIYESLTSDHVLYTPPAGGRGGGPVSESEHAREVKLVPLLLSYKGPPSVHVPFPPPLAGGGGGGGPGSQSDQVRQEKCVPKSSKHFTDLVRKEDLERYMASKHFTDLVRMFFCSDSPKNYKQTWELNSSLYSAKKLDRAGVKFEPCTNAHLADVVYEKRRMSLKVKVPKFIVQDDTECVMRNVMALEQCLYPLEPQICNYIDLLDQLIDTAEDVELLIDKGIAQNCLGSNEAVAKLVNKLCDQIAVPTTCYSELCETLNDTYNNWWSVTKETFKRVYFKDLWTSSSTVVGFFLTIFSVVSVISTIKGLISG